MTGPHSHISLIDPRGDGPWSAGPSGGGGGITDLNTYLNDNDYDILMADGTVTGPTVTGGRLSALATTWWRAYLSCRLVQADNLGLDSGCGMLILDGAVHPDTAT